MLAVHKRTHTGDKPYECDVCNKIFLHSGHLVVHKRTHTGEKPYECDVCNNRFLRSDVLAVHKRTHTGEKPYECDVCNKRFSQSSHLSTHKTRARDKPYECHVCNKRFSESHKLTRHKVSAHKRNESFECGICKKTFTQSHLRDGLLLCHTCGKEIIRGQGHANKIRSDDHFVCDKCDKQFPDIESLYQHKAKDHGTSYQCDVCKELKAREATGIGYICYVCVSAMPNLKLPLNLKII
jgi:KRAB domain-containing zinc finger protein